MMYVRDSLDPIVKLKVSTLTCEVICLQVQLRDLKILKLVQVYRNPHTLAVEDDLLHDTLEKIMHGSFKCVIFGDFNLPYIDWATKTAVAPGKLLVDFAAQHNLVQRMLEPTRENHVLDLVLCTEAGLILGNMVRDKLGSSDHRMVSFEIDAGSKCSQGVIMKPDFRRANFRLLRELASHADSTFPEDAGANVCFNIFKE